MTVSKDIVTLLLWTFLHKFSVDGVNSDESRRGILLDSYVSLFVLTHSTVGGLSPSDGHFDRQFPKKVIITTATIHEMVFACLFHPIG